MHILAIYRHYWPDATPYARLLRAILEDQVAQGRKATVFTAQPSYNDIDYSRQPLLETVAGVEVRRISLLPERKHLRVLRMVNYLYFLFRAIVHVLCLRRYDLIVANTHPPVLIGLALRLIRRLRGIPFVLHAQDIHPESALLAKQLREGRFSRWLKRTDTKSCAAAECVVTLSEDMRETLLKRDGYTGENIRVINNFALDVYEASDTMPEFFQPAQPQPFRVFFAGNMGLFQDLRRLVEAAHLLCAERDIQFVFMGTGAELRSLQQLAADLIGKTVYFEPFQAVEVAFACMQRADLGVVSLMRGVCHVAYPSKTMTYLAAGCPLLLLAERDSQLADDVLDHDFGYVPDNTTSAGIAAAIRRARADRLRWTPTAREELTERGETFYGKQRALAAWQGLFAEIEAPTGRRSIPFPTKQPAAQRRAA